MANLIRILVAEDDEAFRRPLVAFLMLHGYVVEGVGCGEDVMGRLRGVDLLLMDVVLPGSSGLEVMTAVRRRHPELPVILMSGLVTPTGAPKAAELGARAFLSKPFEPLDLLNLINIQFAAADGSGPGQSGALTGGA